MWNYNLDEMPKDGTKIVGFFKHNDYESTSVFHYDSGDWRRESHVLPVSTRYLECWTYAPKKPTELLVDWFDHVYPKVSNESGVKYQDGLEIILNLINCVCLPAQDKDLKKVLDWFVVHLGQSEIRNNIPETEFLRVIKERIEFKLAEHGGKQPVMAVSDEKVADNPGLFPKAKPRPCFSCSLPYEGNGKAACTACGKLREKMADSEKDSEFESPRFQVTNRGFGYFKFNDYNRRECTLQKSSLIADEYCVWLGREKNEEPHLGHEMSPRMHLTQSQAKWLGEKLIKFAETGELSDG